MNDWYVGANDWDSPLGGIHGEDLPLAAIANALRVGDHWLERLR
jgi:hypothetical protein